MTMQLYSRGRLVVLAERKARPSPSSVRDWLISSDGGTILAPVLVHRDDSTCLDLVVFGRSRPATVLVHCHILDATARDQLAEARVVLDGGTGDEPFHTMRGVVKLEGRLDALTVRVLVYSMDGRPRTGILDGLNRARLEGVLCDVRLAVEGAELAAHRVALAARCPALHPLLTGTSAEQVIPLENFSRDAAEAFLEFLYTDQVTDWRGAELELLRLAHQYKVGELTDACTLRLWDSDAREALGLLRAAGLSDVLGSVLRRRLTAIVAANMRAIADTREWGLFETAYPTLASAMEAPSLKTPAGASRRLSLVVQGHVLSRPGLRSALQHARLAGAHCDVVLVAAHGEELPAHRLVLAIRSPVLEALLAEADSVELPAFPRRAVDKFLEFLYTDKVRDWTGCEVDLLQLSDEYQVPELRAHGELRLMRCDARAVLRVFGEAGLRRAEVFPRRLGRRLARIIFDNLEDLKDTEEWAAFEKGNNVLADSILGLARTDRGDASHVVLF